MNETIVVNGVTYYREKEPSPTVDQLTERLSWIEQEVQAMLTKAQELYDQMREDGLTIGTVEAEGYLRAAQEMQKWVGYIRENTR